MLGLVDISSEDPLAWDVHLDSYSSLIDAGMGSLSDPDGSTSDMGAYGGPEAGGWDLDGDGGAEWWTPGRYDALDLSDGLDCDDSDPGVSAQSGCADDDGDSYYGPADCDADDASAWEATAAGDCIACTRYVPDDYSGVQDAIDASSDGDTVCVEPGTYTETLHSYGKGITLVGLKGAASTVIDAEGDGTVMTFDPGMGGGTFVLEGFTLTGGYGSEDGGGLYMAMTSPTLRHLVVSGNEAQENGGGLYIVSANPSMTDVIVTENVAGGKGGGLYMDEADPTLTQVTISQNYAADDGGGAYLLMASPELYNVVVSGNEAADSGGGLYLYLYAYADADLTRVLIAGNEAAGSGGGLLLSTASPSLTNVILAGNDSGDRGGGLYMASSSPTLVNVTNVGNTAETGGGVYLYASEPTLTNTTITDNLATTGGGLYDSDSSSDPGLIHCNVYGNAPDNCSGLDDQTTINGNISSDPDFLDRSSEDPGDWDLHLSTASPLVDTGDDSLTDPNGSISDIGAYGGPGADLWDLDGDGDTEWWAPGHYDVDAFASGLDCDDLDPDVGSEDGCDDDDGDGYYTPADCDDDDADLHPEKEETCDASDEDCDGEVDEGLTYTQYSDADGDGYGDPDGAREFCFEITNYADVAGDCDDADEDIYPGATEARFDGIDSNCDGQDDADDEAWNVRGNPSARSSAPLWSRPSSTAPRLTSTRPRRRALKATRPPSWPMTGPRRPRAPS